jgi:branched-chain amino acid transport system permease protein
MASVVQDTINAISLGSLYALVALGIALIFGIMNLINFAHAQIIMLAGYTTLALSHVPWPVLVFAPIAVAVGCAVAMERVAFRPVRGADASTLLITSFAVSYLIQNVVTLIFQSTSRAVELPAIVTQSFIIGDVVIQKLDVMIIVTTAVSFVGLAGFLTRTSLGVQMRAAADDFQMARLLGVRANAVISAAFAISGILAGIVALVFVSQTGQVTPSMAVGLTLLGFVATVVGGMGSAPAAALGGFLLGVVTVLLEVFLPNQLQPYRDAFVFAAVILILLARPQGLLRVGGTVRV